MQVRDCGDASPRNMRLTLNYVPCSADMAKVSAMPLAVVLQPLALPGPDDDELPVCALKAASAGSIWGQPAVCCIDNDSGGQFECLLRSASIIASVSDPLHCNVQSQVVDFGESGPVRCTRCKAYINAFMAFVDAGRKFRCNICGHLNHTCALPDSACQADARWFLLLLAIDQCRTHFGRTKEKSQCGLHMYYAHRPDSYFSQLGPDGRRIDVYERPELCRGAVEFVATSEYMVGHPTTLFLLPSQPACSWNVSTTCLTAPYAAHTAEL